MNGMELGLGSSRGRDRAGWLAVGLLLAAGATALSGCRSSAADIGGDGRWARADLVPTYTPLPPASATITPLPSGTPTHPFYTPTPDQFEAAGGPVRLEIPAIGVDAGVEQVGRLPNGKMDVPKVPANVAWFVESALPGQDVGRPSVMSGHLDSPAGRAVFFDLRKLVPGDELAVTYANGDRYIFRITKKERYAHDEAPVDRIFGPNPEPMLNLFTCDGSWDRANAIYTQRLVVYSRLKGGGAAAPAPIGTR